MTPTARSLEWLRDNGYIADVAERWLPRGKVRRDLFGFVDIVAVGQGECVFVQTTTSSNAAARVEKCRNAEAFGEVVNAGVRVVVHAWAKRGKAGARKLWTCREVEVT